MLFNINIYILENIYNFIILLDKLHKHMDFMKKFKENTEI